MLLEEAQLPHDLYVQRAIYLCDITIYNFKLYQ